ncbi:MAG: hypothetical protein K1X57_17555 [Gemmataceae bacterium]|nr:hypothetical protein [Gemmataceae bacterium]
MATVFPDLDTLTLAISSGLTPATEPVVAGRDPSGRIVVEWSPPESVGILLSHLGIVAEPALPVAVQSFDHWLQLIPVGRESKVSGLTPQSIVLFEVDRGELSHFVTELLRLGHDRWEVMTTASHAYVRAVGPPYYTLLTALDRADDRAPRAYREVGPNVWIEFGAAHPLASQVEAPAESMILIRRDGVWSSDRAGPFSDAGAVVEVSPATNVAVAVSEPTESNIVLELAVDSGMHRPTLWRIPTDRFAEVDEFVSGLGPAGLDRYLIAVAKGGAVLRLRPGPPTRDDGVPPGEPFRTYHRFPNLFVPTSGRLDPPVLRDTLRRLLAADPATLTWISSESRGSVADEAFRPLASWIDRVIDRDRGTVMAWIRSSEFAFADRVLEELAAPAAPKTPVPAKTKVKEPPVAEEPAAKRERPMRRPEPIRAEREGVPRPPDELRDRLVALEQQFIGIEGPLDHPNRQALWPQLARLNAELRQPAESALAWTHAVWESPRPADEQLWGWVRAERAVESTDVSAADLDRLLAPETPAVSDVRAVAALLTWAGWQQPVPGAVRARLADLQTYLNKYERMLPVRVLWLTWSAWSRAAGGDALAMAKARDRLLARLLEHGLSPEADLPGFLRYAGRQDSDSLREVRGWIEETRTQVRSWCQIQTKENPTTSPTIAYIDLMFAFGYARLGEAAAARELMKSSTAMLDDIASDTRDAHLVLLQGFVWRIEQSLQGLPHAGPLPKELLEYLANMHTDAERMPRSNEYNRRRTGPYAIERLREQSRILEPLEKFDPYRHTRREGHELVRKAARLPDERDPGRLVARINEVLRPTQGVPEMRVRVLAECVPLLGRLGAEFAGSLLDQVPPVLGAVAQTNDVSTLETRLRLIERSLFFAAHFDRGDLVPQLVDRLVNVVSADAATSVLEATGQAIGQTLRGMRRSGLRDDAIELLDRLESVILRGDSFERLAARPPRNWPAIMQTLLPLAAGWLVFERPERGMPILEAAQTLLFTRPATPIEKVAPPQYAQITVGLIGAFGVLPPNEARQRISALFAPDKLERLPNTFTTAPFYSRFHITIAEAVVLTMSGDEFALGPAARRWLDEDEYLIRRRVHRDVRSALEHG